MSMMAKLKTITGFFPFTIASLILGAACFWAYQSFAKEEQDLILSVLCIGFGLLLGLQFLQLVLSTLFFWLALRKKENPLLKGSCFEPLATGFKVKGYFLFPTIKITIKPIKNFPIAFIFKPQGFSLAEEVICQRRLKAKKLKCSVVFEDIMGLVRFRFSINRKLNLDVASRALIVSDTLKRAIFTSGDQLSHPFGNPIGDLVELRQHENQAPARHLFWRAFARSRKLVVKYPENAITQKNKSHLYFVPDRSDEPSAALAKKILKNFEKKPFTFQIDGLDQQADNYQKSLELLQDSSQIIDLEKSQLKKHLTESDEAMRLVFLPPRGGAWVRELIQTNQGLNNTCVFITVNKSDPSDQKAFLKKQRWPWQNKQNVEVSEYQAALKLYQKLNKHFVTAIIEHPSGRIVKGGKSLLAKGKPGFNQLSSIAS